MNQNGISWDPGLTLIAACIRNHIPSKVWGEITNPSPNFNGYSVEVLE